MFSSHTKPSAELPHPEFTIPKTSGCVDADEQQASLGPYGLAAEAVSQSRFRILVVDDEPLFREISKVVLEAIGYEVLTTADGLEGLDALSKFSPDVIISDLNMSRMSGFEFLAIVRQRFPHIGTIAMSGGHSTGDIPSGVFADAFVQKANYSIKELSHQVAKLLANRVPANGRRAMFNPKIGRASCRERV